MLLLDYIFTPARGYILPTFMPELRPRAFTGDQPAFKAFKVGGEYHYVFAFDKSVHTGPKQSFSAFKAFKVGV